MVKGPLWIGIKVLFIENRKGLGTKINDILLLSEEVAKLFLTLFRLVAIGFLGFGPCC